MKKFLFALMAAGLVVTYPAAGQKSGFLNKVSKSVSGVSNEVLGKNEKSDKTAKIKPEPPCASDQAIVAMDLGGKLHLDYSELTVSILSDGRILAQAHGADEYYIAKDGVTTGPYKAGDPQIADFVPRDDDHQAKVNPAVKFKPYVTKSGDKYIITFAGKKYGPYARIDNFVVSSSKNKFAAMVTENTIMNEDESKKMEEAMKNAKDDQERMEIAMQYSQVIQQNVANGGPESLRSTLISNVPDAAYDPMKIPGAALNNEIKYDDILLTTVDNKIYSLQGKLLFSMKQGNGNPQKIFVNSDNSRYATYEYGKLTFSDNTSLTDLFNPALVSADGKTMLSYMYYSPKHNAIMQHKIPF